MWDDTKFLLGLCGVIVVCLSAYWLMGGGFFDTTLR